MEDYAAKMLLKTDAALREYVTGHVQYREAAVLAALEELRRRGQPAPEEAALRPSLEAGAAAQRTLDEAAETERRSTMPTPVEAEETGPALYSPGTILMFSLFFSMLAGGILLGLNLGRLRRWGALVGLVIFLILYLIASSLALNWLVARFGFNPLISLALNLPAIGAYLLWFWPRHIGAESYQSRSWLMPFLVCIVLALTLQMGGKYLLKQPHSPEVEKILNQ
jgi:hypothetical protein